jgi:hypothetical protein
VTNKGYFHKIDYNKQNPLNRREPDKREQSDIKAIRQLLSGDD